MTRICGVLFCLLWTAIACTGLAPGGTSARKAHVTEIVSPVAQGAPQEGELRSARIRSAGDFVIHTPIIESARRLAQSAGAEYSHEFGPMLDAVREVLGDADFTVVNVDGSMGGEHYYKYGYSGYPQFNTPPYLLYALRDAGVDMLTLATNHILDSWFNGLLAEIENVEKAGLYHVGAHRSMEEKKSPVIVEINGIRVGFLNYTESLNSMDARPDLDPDALLFGVNAVRYCDMEADARTLREAGADVIVCYMHWGTEYEEEISAAQQECGERLMRAGVDVIVGGHPHVVQPARWLTGLNQFGEMQSTLCVYSMGNFLSDQRQAPRDGGILFDFTIQEQPDGSFAITDPAFLSTWVWRAEGETGGYDYQVLPASLLLENPPAEMTEADYLAMLESHRHSAEVMN